MGFRLKRGFEGTPETGLGVGAGPVSPGLITTESKTEASETREEHAELSGVSDECLVVELEVTRDDAELLV